MIRSIEVFARSIVAEVDYGGTCKRVLVSDHESAESAMKEATRIVDNINASSFHGRD